MLEPCFRELSTTFTDFEWWLLTEVSGYNIHSNDIQSSDSAIQNDRTVKTDDKKTCDKTQESKESNDSGFVDSINTSLLTLLSSVITMLEPCFRELSTTFTDFEWWLLTEVSGLEFFCILFLRDDWLLCNCG
jgi:hypothetical protein